MKIAHIDADRIQRIYTEEEASWYPEGVLDLREVPDEAQEGWVWDGAAWVEPPEPEPTSEPLADPLQVASLRMSVMSMMAANPDAADAVMITLTPVVADVAVTWTVGRAYLTGEIIMHEDRHYMVVLPITAQAHQPPGSEGMLTHYRPFDSEQHTGTIDDPIPWAGGMDCYMDNYYNYEGKVYLLTIGNLTPCPDNWYPGAPGMHHWQLVTS